MKRLKTLATKVKCQSAYGAVELPADGTWPAGTHPYKVTLRYKGRRLTVPFFMGPALTEEPDAVGVLDCLLSDSTATDQSFEEFCNEFGYDADSRKAERLYQQCCRLGEKLKRFLGVEYETFLSADRN